MHPRQNFGRIVVASEEGILSGAMTAAAVAVATAMGVVVSVIL